MDSDVPNQQKISIAVLPFENLSKEEDLEHFALGFAEDLRIELSKFPPLRVVASQSILSLLKSGGDIEDVADEWDLDYVFRAGIRKRSSALRVSLKLISCSDMRLVWADHLDGEPEAVVAIQDALVGKLANRLTLYIDEDTLGLARGRQSDDLNVYDCYLRGVECLSRGTLDGDEESREFFGKALKIDPNYSRAYVGLSLSYFNEWSCQAWHLWEDSERNAFDYATKAIELDDTDAMAHAVLGRVHRYRREHERADIHANQALRLNPNDATVVIQVALVRLFGGDWEQAEMLAREAIRLNPLQSDWYHGVLGWSLFFQNRIEEALSELRIGGNFIVNFGLYRSACLLQSNDPEGAREAFAEFASEYRRKVAFGREPEPGEAVAWAVRVEPFLNEEDSQRMPSILADAGLTELDFEDTLRCQGGADVRSADIPTSPENRFLREDDVWTVAYQGTAAQLVELKGFHDIAFLLRQPRESVHAIELMGGAETTSSRQEQLDGHARREYRERIEELQLDIERATSDGETERADSVREERDALVEELARATGFGGRTRTMTHAAERARSAVTWRIRSAIKKIQAAHPELGQHLANSVRTGIFCVYEPEKETFWEV